MKPIIWVLNSAPGGDRNASISVAELINPRFKIIEIPQIDNLPNANNNELLKEKEALPFNQLGFKIASKYMRRIKPANYPQLVINTWKHKSPIAVGIKEFLSLKNHDCKIVNISMPHGSLQNFDLIALPDHFTKIKKEKNVLLIRGTCHLVNSKRLNEGKNKFKPIFQSLPKPILLVLIGGNSGEYVFTNAAAKKIGHEINALALKTGASIVATNSHRTPPHAWESFCHQISCKHYFFDSNKKPNPFFSSLANANYIFCTGDSLSMVTEAASTGKPCFIIPSQGNKSIVKEFKSFNRKMLELENVALWKDALHSIKFRPVKKQVSNSEKVAAKIKELFHART